MIGTDILKQKGLQRSENVMELYRYISFEEFVSLITLKQLHFVQPTQWPDTYEGFIYRIFNDDSYKEMLLSNLYDKLPDGTPEERASTALTNYCGILHATTNWYGQCWTYDGEESDSFWRIYSHGDKSIRIHTTDEKIEKLFDPDHYYTAQKPVTYDKESTKAELIKLQIEAIYNAEKTTEGFFHKRVAFSHEKEYRVLISPKETTAGKHYDYNDFMNSVDYIAHLQLFDNKLLDSKEKCLLVLMDCIKTLVPPALKREPHFNVKVGNVPNFITDVLVTPLAADWYVDLVKGVCDQNGITFTGKSHLYDSVL